MGRELLLKVWFYHFNVPIGMIFMYLVRVYRLNKKCIETVDLTFENVKTLYLIFTCLQVMHIFD